MPGDVSSPEDIKRMVNSDKVRREARYSVNNAAYSVLGVTDIDLDDWHRSLM